MRFAATNGWEPTHHITIHWGLAPGDAHPAERVSALVNSLGVWLRKKSAPVVWAYAREVHRTKTEHLHLVAYIPAPLDRDLIERFRRWVANGATAGFSPKAVDVRRINVGDLRKSTALLRPSQSARSTDTRGTLRSYLLKEGDPEARAKWVDNRHKATGGVIEGKRMRVSHSIDRRARRTAESDAAA